MSKRKKEWDTKENAEAYDEYANNFSMYKDTSKDLVKISKIKPKMRIVDLAAGTGITAKVVFDKVGADVYIIAVDQSEMMLRKAKEKFLDKKNTKFIIAEAENLDKVVKKQVDVIICNSAFWQIKPREVFKAASNVLKYGGIFAFNLPDQYFNYNGFNKQPRKPLSYNLDDLVTWGKEAGLYLIDQSVKEYKRNLSEITAFSKIPVMQKNFKSAADRESFISDTTERMKKNSYKKSQWLYLAFTKQKRGAAEARP